jgi:hypothetical protein
MSQKDDATDFLANHVLVSVDHPGDDAMLRSEQLRKHADRVVGLALKARERGHLQCSERLGTWAIEISNEAAAFEAWHSHPSKGVQRRMMQQPILTSPTKS